MGPFADDPTMAASIALFAIFFLLVEPLLVLAHELGHAAVVLATGEDPTVAMGGDEGKRFGIGPVAFVLHPVGLLNVATFGACYYEVDLGRWQTIAFALAGPAVTLGLLAAAWSVTTSTTGPVGELAEIAVIYLGIQAAITLLPVQYPSFMGQYAGFKSDGRVALEVSLGWNRSPNEHLSAPTTAED